MQLKPYRRQSFALVNLPWVECQPHINNKDSCVTDMLSRISIVTVIDPDMIIVFLAYKSLICFFLSIFATTSET
jgi:hypothetical protein